MPVTAWMSHTAMGQELEELSGTPPHNRSTIDAKHLLPTERHELPLLHHIALCRMPNPCRQERSIWNTIPCWTRGVLLTVQMQKIGHGLADMRDNLAKVVELQQLLAKKQQRKLAKRNANWDSRYDVMRREKEQ